MKQNLRSKRSTKKQTKNNSKQPLILGGFGLLVIVISYFFYSNKVKNDYVQETLSYQNQVNKNLEDGEFKKGLQAIDSVLTRIKAKDSLFTDLQKAESNRLSDAINTQIQLQEILAKLKLEFEGEPSKSFVAISKFRAKLNENKDIQNNAGSFIQKEIKKFQEQCFATQLGLFTSDYKKQEEVWASKLEQGDFSLVAKSIKEYLDGVKDETDKEWAAYLKKSYSESSNKYLIQNQLYQDAMIIYNKGIGADGQEFQKSIKDLEGFITNLPLEYPILKKALKTRLEALKNSVRSRYKKQMDLLPLSQLKERDVLRKKAFALEMPSAPKITFTQISKADLDFIMKNVSATLPEFTLESSSINEEENYILLKGKEYIVQVGFALINNVSNSVFVVNGVRIAFGPKALDINQLKNNRLLTKNFMNFIYEVAQNIKMIDEACQMPEVFWYTSDYSYLDLGLIAKAEKDETLYLLVEDKIFKSKEVKVDKQASSKKIEEFRSLVKELATQISLEKNIEKEIVNSVSLFITAISENIKPDHFLSSHFAQLALVNNYFENAIPNCPENIKSKINQLKNLYLNNIANPVAILQGVNDDGSDLLITETVSGFPSLRIYDKERNESIFIKSPFIIELDGNYMKTTHVASAMVYEGKHMVEEPSMTPIRIESRHLSGGIIAIYDYPKQQFICDQQKWDRSIMMLFNLQPIFGSASWAIPPHVLNIAANGSVDEMYVPRGKFSLKNFSEISNEEEKLAAKNKWLDEVANVLQKTGELHLIFKYFSKYVFDSPIPNMNDLIGNNDSRGDYHQTVYQTIERNLGGKMLCDCDDLAEVYADIIRRQGKLSYVLNVPGHATCGWVEKAPEGGFILRFLDTGSPRKIIDKTLDGVLEKGVKSYDQRNLMGFNPRSIAFLFRFAGEEVRQGYYLDAKVMVDAEYGKAMVDVQEAWHFHYFLQGLKTMEEILKKDKASANFFEIAGLYREMGLKEKAAETYKEGLNNLDTKDEFGMLQSSSYYLTLIRKTKPEEASKIAADVLVKLPKVSADARSKELVEFGLANYYLGVKKVMDSYRIIERFTKDVRYINERLIYTFIAIYSKLNEKSLKGQTITDEEKVAIANLDKVIQGYLNTNHFQQTDDVGASIAKYGTFFSYFIGKYGWDVCLKKLSNGEFPKNMNKKHLLRNKPNEDEDWEWIRLNIGCYSTAFSKTLADDKDETDEEDDLEEVKMPSAEKWKAGFVYQDLAEKAYRFHLANGFGKQSEYNILLLRMIRGVVEKKETLVDATLDKMQKDDWTAFYRMMADSIGGLIGIVPDADFIALFKKFSNKNPPKQHFLGIAYRAMSKKKYDVCLAVGEITANKFKDESKMQVENNLLKSFVSKLKLMK